MVADAVGYQVHLPSFGDSTGDGLGDLAGADARAGVTAYRRGGLWAVANLRDATAAEVELPAPAVFDSDDPEVTPERPRTGRVRLAPQQALLLAGPWPAP